MKIYLASNSPRRRQLLSMIEPDFEIMSGRDTDETYPAELEPEKVPEYLSRLKAAAYAGQLEPGDVLITADTVVLLDGEILGKPADLEEAKAMLRKMSGKTHTVITGLCLTALNEKGEQKTVSHSEHTSVHFAKMSDDEINYYVEAYRPLDKAGAYGIQEWTAAVVKGIDGCFYNVMGLPIHALYRMLSDVRASGVS